VRRPETRLFPRRKQVSRPTGTSQQTNCYQYIVSREPPTVRVLSTNTSLTYYAWNSFNLVKISALLFSSSLSINIASVSASGVELSPSQSVGLCVCVCLSVRKVSCGKTADWIRMPFGMVTGVGRWGALDGGGDSRRRRASFGVNLGRPVVTSGDFVA